MPKGLIYKIASLVPTDLSMHTLFQYIPGLQNNSLPSLGLEEKNLTNCFNIINIF